VIAIEKVTSAPRAGIPPAQPAPFHARSFRVTRLTVSAFVESGPERPVIFLHGNSSTKAVWVHQLALMRREGRGFLAPDLPGHGESENSATPHLTYSFPGYAVVIRGLIDALGWNAVDVVGWSLGGHIGLELLAVEERVRSLLIVGSPPARPCAESLVQVFHATDSMQLASQTAFSDADAVAYGTAMMGGAEQLTAPLLESVKRTDGNARHCLFSSVVAGVGSDQRATVAALDRPLCVAHGEDEPFVRLDYLRSLHYRRLWNDRIYVIAQAGHAPHWQQPLAFNEVLSGFLAYVRSRELAAKLALPKHANPSDSRYSM